MNKDQEWIRAEANYWRGAHQAIAALRDSVLDKVPALAICRAALAATRAAK